MGSRRGGGKNSISHGGAERVATSSGLEERVGLTTLPGLSPACSEVSHTPHHHTHRGTACTYPAQGHPQPHPHSPCAPHCPHPGTHGHDSAHPTSSRPPCTCSRGGHPPPPP